MQHTQLNRKGAEKHKDNREINATVFLLLKSKEALNYEEIRKCYFND